MSNERDFSPSPQQLADRGHKSAIIVAILALMETHPHPDDLRKAFEANAEAMRNSGEDIEKTERDGYEEALSHIEDHLPPPRYAHTATHMNGAQFGDRSAIQTAVHLLIATHPNKANLKAAFATHIAEANTRVHALFGKDRPQEFTNAAISHYDAGMANMAGMIDTVIDAQASILQAANQEGADAA